jgi:hypothetical protein
MKNLIIPMGGKSSRFPNMRPKWMLTHPSTGNFMCIESIRGINLDFFDNIFFVILESHDLEYKASSGIKKSLENLSNYSEIKEKIKIIELEKETKSQSETVYKAILKNKIEGFIYIKDSDGYFNIDLDSSENQITYFDINNLDEINARSKSYIDINSNNIITNIVEKKVISSKFCVGGYGFSSSNEFCKFYEKIENYPGECYVSNVILEMILEGNKFSGMECQGYLDWGTLKSWESYKSNFYTLFVDMDGTLFTNTSHLIPPFIGEGIPLIENIKCIKEIKKEGSFLIITTSRPEKYRKITESELNKYDIPFDLLIMGLPHCQRVLINDFSNTNPYPSCYSVNIPRNSDNLNQYIKIND